MLKKIMVSLVVLASVVAIPVLAESGKAKPQVSQSTLACVQTAVDAREQALDTAFTTFSSAVSNALSARKTALHNAWGIADGKSRREARSLAWSTFKSANKSAYEALRSSRKAAWEAFKTASAACKVPVVESTDKEGEGSLGL